MSYTPTRIAGRTASTSEVDNAEYLNTRMRIIRSMNPYMSERPDAMLAMSQTDLTAEQLVDQSAQMYGMMTGTRFADQLKNMTPAAQRGIWARLPRAQQMALEGVGFSEPDRDHGLISETIGNVAQLGGKVIGGGLNIASKVGGPVVSDVVLPGLNWIGNWPGHLYRSIQLMDDQQRALGGIGALAGTAAALAFAPVTGGGSLAVLGAMGLGALAGGTAGAAVTAPMDWWRAFDSSWNGERTFDRNARARADQLLGDPRLVGLAEDLAQIDGLTLDDLAVDMAALGGGVSEAGAFRAFNEIALRMGVEGSTEYQSAFRAMINTYQLPAFREAVETLQNGKMSPGRDLADTFGLEPGTSFYNAISGTLDLAFTVAVDPILALGLGSKLYRARKLGIQMIDGAPLATELTRKFALPSVTRMHEEVVKAINGEHGIVNTLRLRQIAPEYERVLPDIRDHLEMLRRTNQVAADAPLDVKVLQSYLVGNTQLSPILQGVGNVRSGERIILRDYQKVRQGYRQFSSNMRSFVHGMADPAMEHEWIAATRQMVDDGATEMSAMVPEAMDAYLTEHGLLETPWLFNEANPRAAAAGRVLGQALPDWVPVGRIIDMMTTMTPPGYAVTLTGPEAPAQIRAMTEMGSFFGMPSWVRRWWADSMLTTPSTAVRQELAIGWLDNAMTIAGGRSAPELAAFTDEFLTKSRQVFGFDDVMTVAGKRRHVGMMSSHTADEIVMPSLKQIRKAAMTGTMARLIGIGDLAVFEAGVNKIWKPAVLLRLAFIPRAVGEEMLAFFLRGGSGSLGQQFAARSIADRDLFDAAKVKMEAGLKVELTPGEAEAWAKGRNTRLPAHVRVVQRMMDHTDWRDPSFKQLERYGDFLRDSLSRGIGNPNKVRNVPGEARAIPRPETGFRIQFADNRNQLLMGNKYSWRRMMGGGVDNDMVVAAREWGSFHRTAMMRGLSTRHTGPLDTDADPRHIEVRQIKDKGSGKVRDVEYVNIPGERELAMVGDDAYDGHLHRAHAESIEDDVRVAAYMRHVALTKGKVALADSDILEILTPLRRLPSATRGIVNEFLSEPNRDTFNAMLNWLGSRHPELAETLKMLPNLRNVSYDEMLRHIDDFRRGLARPWEADLEAMHATAGADVVDRAVMEPAWFRDILDDKAMSSEAVRQRALDRRAQLEADPDPDELDWAASQADVDWSAVDPLNRNRRTGDVDDVDDGWGNEFADAPWGDWTMDSRGQIVSPDGVTAPKHLAELEAQHAKALEYEHYTREIKFNTDEAEIRAYRDENLHQGQLEVDSVAGEMLNFGGPSSAIDPRTGKVVFYGLKPDKTPEWDWWRQLTPRTRQGLAMRYFRSSGMPVVPLDVIADRAGMTVNEWSARFLELTGAYDDSRRTLSSARKATRKVWRERYEADNLGQLEAINPGRTSGDIAGEMSTAQRAIEELPGARARAAANRAGGSDADFAAEPTPVILPTRAELEQARIDSLVAEGPRGDTGPSVPPATPMDPKARREADRALRDRPPVDAHSAPDDEWFNMGEPAEFVERTYQVDVDPETLDDFYRSLAGASGAIARIAELNDYERGFVGQLARGMDRPGSGFHLADLERSVLTDGPSPFYSSLDEAMPHIEATLAAEALNPHRNDAAQSLIRLSNDAANPALTGSTVQLYQAPSFRGPRKFAQAANKPFGYSDILEAATNKRIISDNQDVVTALLRLREGDRVPALANLELARELRRIDAKLKHGGDVMAKGDVTMVPMPREILDGRMHDGDGLIPVVKRANKGTEETQLWSLRSSMYSHRFTQLPKTAAVRAEEYARDAAADMRLLLGRGTESWRTPRERTLRDGTKAPLVYVIGPDGVNRPVAAGTKITDADRFTDRYGKPIANDDQGFWEFGGGTADEAGDPVWEMLGAMMEDMWDSRLGGVRMLPKQRAGFGSGKVIESTDSVRVYRSRKEHVGRIGRGRPNQIWGQKMVPVTSSAWDRFVRWGFDTVIGGPIDAIARRPMAFHYFQQRFTENMRLTQWLVDPVLAEKMTTIKRQVVALRGDDAINNVEAAKTARRVAAHHGVESATGWTDHEALAWLRGQNVDDLGTMLKSAVIAGRANKDRELAGGAAAMLRVKPERVLTAVETEATPQQFLRFVESQLPPGALEHPAQLRSPAARKALAEHPTLSHFTDDDWDTVLAFSANQRFIHEAASHAAAIGAINDMTPFIDSHEFKTQFAEYGKGFLPFWYAEENFMKRWVRGLVDAGPAMIRRAQLSYMGLKEAGVVRTDESGKDWFVYPGSTLLADVISKIHPSLGMVAGGIMFQTPTDAMLPGVNNRFGAPAFNPLVTLPVEFAASLFPELKPVETSLSGPYGDKGIIETVVPSFVTNTFNAVLSDERTNERYGAAMFSAMAQLQATGHGLADDATAGQRDAWMRRIRDHARIIVVAQSLMSFVSPGPPSPINAGTTGSLTGRGIENPAEVFSSAYIELVRGLGIEQGTIKYLELYKDANLYDVVNPIVYTQGRTETPSGAQLGSTEAALAWYDDNSDYLDELPSAAPWLLPQEYLDGRRAETAYDSQLVSGLRNRLTPDDFLTALKFKEGATEYFIARDRINAAIAEAEMADDVERVRILTARWQNWSGNYRATHPIFDQELTGGDGLERRQSVIAEMRIAVADPKAPPSTRLDDIRTMMNMYDAYSVRLATLGADRSAKGRVKVEELKGRYARAMDMVVRQQPKLASFWTSILRPESSLN